MDIPGLNPIDVERILRVTAMTCNVFRASDHGNARPHTTGEGIRCLSCDDQLWKHWLRQALMSAEHLAEGAVGLVEAERKRQIGCEGWTSEHDDEHTNGELRDAAIAYAMVCDDRAGENAADIWPFEPSWWKPSDDPIRNLVRAGALIAAEIERLQRRRWPNQ